MVIKKIDVSQLQPGMFVTNFKTQWEKHPFYLRRLRIESPEQIRLVAGSGIQEVFIDTRLGRDVSLGCAMPGPVSRRSPSAQDIREARRLLEHAAAIVRRTFNDVRLGRKMDIEAMRQITWDLAESVIQDRDLMMLVCGMHQRRPSVFIHSVNVCMLLSNFALHQGLDAEKVRALALAGLLHDLGLGDGEGGSGHHRWAAANDAHVGKTLSQLAGFDLAPETMAAIAEHHERADGSGYPRGVGGDEISPWGAMASIADAYDQLCSPRLCGPGFQDGVLTPAAAMGKIFEWSGRYFDADLGAGFVRALGIYPEGSLVRLESGLLAVVIAHRPDALLHPRVRVIYDTNLPGAVDPEDRDFSDPRWANDSIVGPEMPEKWGISTGEFLTEAVCC